jgi:hypothetical protein
LGLRLSGTLVDASHEVGPEDYERDPRTGQPLATQPAEHLLDLALFAFDLEASLGFSDRGAIEVLLPLRMASIDASFPDESGVPIEGFSSIHHRSETLFGPGDLEIAGRFRLLAPSHDRSVTIDLRAGLSFPTGGTEENPYRLTAQGLEHQHVFFGSGTLDPILGLEAQISFDSFDLSAFVSGRASLYRNVHGLRRGARMSLGTAVVHSFGLEDWQFRLGPELYAEAPETWQDGERSENSGRIDLIAAGGVTWRATSSTVLELLLRKPFTLSSEGGQLEIPLTVSIGAQKSFDL